MDRVQCFLPTLMRANHMIQKVLEKLAPQVKNLPAVADCSGKDLIYFRI